MAVIVYIPTPFRRATGNRDRVEVRAKDVRAMLDELEAAHAGLRGLVRSDSGELHRHVSIYVNSEAIEGLGTPLKDGDEVAIIPALAGRACCSPGQRSPRSSSGPPPGIPTSAAARSWRAAPGPRTGRARQR